jgi:hypothetical protein
LETDPPIGTKQRLEKAVSIAVEILESFEAAARDFERRDLEAAQSELSEGVDTLTTFVNWYLLVLRSDEKRLASVISQIDDKIISPLQKVCDDLAESELYSSSTALSIAISEQLLPRLRDLHHFTQAALEFYLRADI